MRLTGAIPKQSNFTVQIQPPPWLNLRRKPELDLLPLKLDFLYRRHTDTAAANSRQCFCCGAVNLSDSNQHNLSAIQALARLSDNKASYRNFITLALGKHLVDNAPSVGVLRCSKIQ